MNNEKTSINITWQKGEKPKPNDNIDFSSPRALDRPLKKKNSADFSPLGNRARIQKKASTTTVTLKRQSVAALDFQIKQHEAKDWIKAVVGEEIGEDFFGSLRDGVILIKLIQKIFPKCILGTPRTTKAAFIMMQNVEAFTKACQSYGLTNVFLPSDLVNLTNTKQVLSTIIQLAELAEKRGFTPKLEHVDEEKFKSQVESIYQDETIKKIASYSPQMSLSNQDIHPGQEKRRVQFNASLVKSGDLELDHHKLESTSDNEIMMKELKLLREKVVKDQELILQLQSENSELQLHLKKSKETIQRLEQELKSTKEEFEYYIQANPPVLSKNTSLNNLLLNIPDDIDQILNTKESPPPQQSIQTRKLTLTRLFDPTTELQDDKREILPWTKNDPIIRSFSVKEDANKKGGKRKGQLAKLHPSETEDRYVVLFPYNDNGKRGLFCIFDGHSGADCADQIHTIFPKIFADILGSSFSSDDVPKLFKQTYLKADNQVKSMEYMGCTATTIFVWQDGEHRYLQAANLGDSAGYLKTKSGVKKLTMDHKLTSPEEKTRLQSLGIKLNENATRLHGMAVTRAFGDHFFKNEKVGLISEPSISERFKIEPGDILILASDGLWDVMDGETALEIADKSFDAKIATRRLMKSALADPQCLDNITIIVVMF